MKTKTIIHSNGSRWGGEKPATINELIGKLKSYTIEDRFFGKYKSREVDEEGNREWIILCPIDKDRKTGNYIFFGNFEEYSHVFRIETNDIKIIEKLKNAILSNKGWRKYKSLFKKCSD